MCLGFCCILRNEKIRRQKLRGSREDSTYGKTRPRGWFIDSTSMPSLWGKVFALEQKRMFLQRLYRPRVQRLQVPQ
jgi:hypothetical protein